MPQNEPPEAADPLEALREQIRATQEAAERLAREASESVVGQAARMRGGERVPPRGYAVPGHEDASSGASAEILALVGLWEALRTLVPPEVRAQLAELVRELLLLVRALIDWYLDRVDPRRTAPVEVEDIPIT